MAQFVIGQRVKITNGKIGVIKGFGQKREAIIWFDEEGLDIGVYSVASLTKVNN